MKNKLKIGIFLSSNEASGGTFQYNYTIYEILSNLEESDLELILFYTDPIWKTLISKKNNLIQVPITKTFRFFFRISIILNLNIQILRIIFKKFNIIKLIEKEKCNFIIYPSQDYISFLSKTPSVVAIHDLMHRYEKHFNEYSNGEIRRRDYIYNLICKNSKLILCDSNCGKSHVIDSYNISEEKIQILPFIPPTYFDNCHFVDLERLYNLKNDFIFYPAAFWEHKNHKNLLLAFTLVLNEYPNLKLVLVGAKKNHYDKTVKLINELKIQDAVYILNYVDNNSIYTLYKKCKLMTYVSLLGPTNIPPIEAIYLDCPFICSKSYGMPEQVGDCGVLVDANNPEDIYIGIKKILNLDYNIQLMRENYIVRTKDLKSTFNESLFEILLKLKNE